MSFRYLSALKRHNSVNEMGVSRGRKEQVRLVSAKAERPNHPSREGQPARGGSQPGAYSRARPKKSAAQ